MAEAKKDEHLEPEAGFTEEGEAFHGIGAEQDVDEVEALRVERDEMRDRFMRALADAENSRKRGERDRREAEQYGGSKLARDMLPIYDHLNRALDVAGGEQSEESKALVEGVQLTLRELLNVFSQHGVKLVQPEPGEKFEPEMREAMFEAALPGTRTGDIIQVMEAGFMLHDRLLRPAKVGVSSTPAE